MKFQNFSYNAHYVNKTSSTKSIRIFSRVTVHTTTNVHSSRLHRVTRTRLCVALVKSLKKNYRKNRTLCPSAVEKSGRKSHENSRKDERNFERIDFCCFILAFNKRKPGSNPTFLQQFPGVGRETEFLYYLGISLERYTGTIGFPWPASSWNVLNADHGNTGYPTRSREPLILSGQGLQRAIKVRLIHRPCDFWVSRIVANDSTLSKCRVAILRGIFHRQTSVEERRLTFKTRGVN